MEKSCIPVYGKLEKTSEKGGKTTKNPNRFMVFVMRIVGKFYFNYRLANTLYYIILYNNRVLSEDKAEKKETLHKEKWGIGR